MNRKAHPRRYRRRKAMERANRRSGPALVAEQPLAPTRHEEDPIVGIAHPGPKRIDLPFEMAPENEAVVAKDDVDRQPTAGPMVPETGGDPDVEPPQAGAAPAPSAAEPEEPSAEELLYNAAREAHAQGEQRRAIAIYRELLSIVPDHVKARNNLALLLDERGDHEEALHELRLCLRTEPTNPQVLVNRGGVLGALGRYTEAESDLRRALEFDATNAEAYFNLGLLMSRRGLWTEALPYLRRSIELDSSRATAYIYLGDALNHVDDLDGALQAYQRSVELVPTNEKAFYGLGIIYDRMNRPEDAQQMYRRSRDLAGR